MSRPEDNASRAGGPRGRPPDHSLRGPLVDYRGKASTAANSVDEDSTHRPVPGLNEFLELRSLLHGDSLKVDSGPTS